MFFCPSRFFRPLLFLPSSFGLFDSLFLFFPLLFFVFRFRFFCFLFFFFRSFPPFWFVSCFRVFVCWSVACLPLRGTSGGTGEGRALPGEDSHPQARPTSQKSHGKYANPPQQQQYRCHIYIYIYIIFPVCSCLVRAYVCVSGNQSVKCSDLRLIPVTNTR